MPQKGRLYTSRKRPNPLAPIGENRPSAHERGYNWRWRRARLLFLAENPLCRTCEDSGKITAATVVDHIIPHRGNQALFWNVSNWRATCSACHASKTARGQ